MYQRRRYRRRRPVARRILMSKLNTWIHFQPDAAHAEADWTVAHGDGKCFVLVAPDRTGGQRGRRVTSGVLKWGMAAIDTVNNGKVNCVFVVFVSPQGLGYGIRFGAGLPMALAQDGSVIGPGSELAEPNQLILAQGIIMGRELGSTYVSFRQANVSAGDCICIAFFNPNANDCRLVGDMVFSYWVN